MKKLLIVAAILLLTGCTGKETVNLMPDAEPATSALSLYVYDGTTITRQLLFHVDDKVMADFQQARAVPAEVDVTTLRLPYYGLEMGGEEKGTIYGLWADGFFIRGDGETYRFDYDFEKLLAAYPWELPAEFENLTLMPCANYLTKTEAGWNEAFLTGAEEPVLPEGLTMEITDQKKKELTVLLTNETGSVWEYGCAFHLEVLLEEQWYWIPAERHMAFTEELYVLPDGETREETYRLEAYGDLPAGIYRIVTDGGLWAMFEAA